MNGWPWPWPANGSVRMAQAGSQLSTTVYMCRNYRRLQIVRVGTRVEMLLAYASIRASEWGEMGGAGGCPVATGDGGMSDSAAMITTGARDLEKEDARTKDGAFALGSASGRCQVDRRVRARRASALQAKLSQ